MTTLAERVNDALRGLRASTPEIIGSALVNMEGFIISSVVPSEVDEELVGGMAASLLGVGERISKDLKVLSVGDAGSLDQVSAFLNG